MDSSTATKHQQADFDLGMDDWCKEEKNKNLLPKKVAFESCMEKEVPRQSLQLP